MSNVAPIAVPERRLSFAFAKRHGVLVKGYVDGVAECVYRADTSPQALAELRRYLRTKVKLQRVEEAEFDALLRTAYEGGNSATMQAAEGLEDSTDLAHLAQELPDQADLLESEDDAPIIRLINAVLTQAVKENASDIHVEPFENRLDRALPCRRRAARSAAGQARRRAARRLAHQGHVEARHRREAPAAGRPHQPQGRRPRGGRSRVDDLHRDMASASCSDCSTSRRVGSTSPRSAWSRRRRR